VIGVIFRHSYYQPPSDELANLTKAQLPSIALDLHIYLSRRPLLSINMGNTISAYKETPCEVTLPGASGTLKGLQFDSKSRRYARVPYALPPTGDHRWQKPRPIPSPNLPSPDTRPMIDCTNFGPVCPQWLGYTSVGHAEKGVDDDKPVKASPHGFDEDCLKLNIWTPVESKKDSEDANKPWPVFFWLHGGWFQLGDPSQDVTMDPTELISTGKFEGIIVAVGYRLNIFGFLAGDALSEEEGQEGGNYGLWDIRLAMEWVKENISAFGGDPNNITLAGRSAGAYAVHAEALYDFRLGQRSSEDQLFHRMVMFSNAIPAQPKTLPEVQPQFDEVCQYFGIPLNISGAAKLEKLRLISATDLVSAIKELKYHTFRPITDGSFIKAGLIEYHKDGQFAARFKDRGLKLLIGEMLNEETLYAVTNPPKSPDIESLELQLENYYAPHVVKRVVNYYGVPNTTNIEDWKLLYGRIVSDGQVRAPVRSLVDSLIRHGVDINDIWRYRISYRLSFINEDVVPKSFGVAHAMDKPLWKYVYISGIYRNYLANTIKASLYSMVRPQMRGLLWKIGFKT